MTTFLRPLLKRTDTKLATSSAQATEAPILTSPFDQDPIDQIKISKDCDSSDTDWPLNNGCNGTVATPHELKPGTLVDRFGRLDGEFFSSARETFRSRSLRQIINKPECKEFYNKKYSKNNKYTATGKNDDWRLANDYHVLKVINPLSVVKCTAAPAFGQPGGATQYWVPKNFNDPFSIKPDKKPNNYTIHELIARGNLELLNKYDPPRYEGGFIKRKRKSRTRKCIKRKGRKSIRKGGNK
jgi:hypothetical protein